MKFFVLPQTNTFQCVLVSDGFRSYVIFLYADGLIQWTTGDFSGGMGGLGGTQAQVGFNAGDSENFASHEYSQTPEVINITRSSMPAGLVPPGVLIYRVDGRMIAGCIDSNDGECCITIHVHVCICAVCVYAFVCAQLCVWVCVHVCTCVMHVCVCMCTCLFCYVCMCMCAYVCVHACMHACVCIFCVHVCVCLRACMCACTSKGECNVKYMM